MSEMTSKERVMATLNHEEPDPVSNDTISYEVSGHELLRITPQKRSLCFYVFS